MVFHHIKLVSCPHIVPISWMNDLIVLRYVPLYTPCIKLANLSSILFKLLSYYLNFWWPSLILTTWEKEDQIVKSHIPSYHSWMDIRTQIQYSNINTFNVMEFTRRQFWPPGIVVVACAECPSVCVCLYQSPRCPHDNSFKPGSPNLDQSCNTT